MTELITTLLKLLKTDSRTFRSGLVSLGLGLVVLGIAWAWILVGLGLIMWALYLYLSVYLSPSIAALVSGLISLLVAASFVWGTRLLITHSLKRKSKKARLQTLGNLSIVRDYPLETALTALAAGFLVGTSSELRKALAENIILLLKQNDSRKD